MHNKVLLSLLSLLWITYELNEGTYASPEPIDVMALRDGMTISKGTTLRGLSATWIVLVSLDEPVYPSELRRQITQVESSFHEVLGKYQIPSAVKKSWLHRLAQLHQSTITSAARVKRGLFDLGGKILHSLFGVATNKQMKQYKKIVKDLRSALGSVVHHQSDLITAVNQSRLYISDNRNSIIHLNEHQKVVRKFLATIRHKMKSIYLRVGALEIRMEMNRVISSLETLHQEYIHQLKIYHIQKASLERGYLTETLLPVAVLESILHKASVAGYDIVSQIEWYYQTLTVEPIWQANNTLIYRIFIPMLDKTNYLYYRTFTYPTPIKNSTYKVKIILKKQYGLDTKSGGLFRPTQCLGKNPVVCLVGPIYNSNSLQCARGLISQQPNYTQHCRVNIYKDISHDTEIYNLNVNTYIISTWGEQLKYHCDGVASKQIYVKPGVYNVTCQANCRLEGHKWHIRCLETVYVKQTLHFHKLNFLPMNISSKINAEVLPKIYPRFKASKDTVVRNINPQTLITSLPDEKPFKWSEYGGFIAWFLAISILILCITLLCIYLYKRFKLSKHILRLRGKCEQPPSAEQVAPPLPLPEIPVVPQI